MALRSDLQNRALHLWFRELADAMNDAGFEQQITIGPSVDVPWSPVTAKILFKKIGAAQFNQPKTSEMTSSEVSATAETMNRFLAGAGIHVPFPSQEEIQNKLKGWKHETFPDTKNATTVERRITS